MTLPVVRPLLQVGVGRGGVGKVVAGADPDLEAAVRHGGEKLVGTPASLLRVLEEMRDGRPVRYSEPPALSRCGSNGGTGPTPRRTAPACRGSGGRPGIRRRCPSRRRRRPRGRRAAGQFAHLRGETLVAQHVVGAGLAGQRFLLIGGNRGDDVRAPGLEQLDQQQPTPPAPACSSTVWPGSTLKEELIR